MTEVTDIDYLSLSCDRLSKCLISGQLTETETEQLKALQHKIDNRIIEIAAFGMVSKGKTAVLNALAGRQVWSTSPLNGTTRTSASIDWQPSLSSSNSQLNPPSQSNDHEISSQSTPDLENSAIATANSSRNASSHPKVQLRLIDTPGLDEIDGESRAELARTVAQQADLILFVIAGDLNRLEFEILAQLQATLKPILLVFNKIDLYPECDRDAIYTALQDKVISDLISTDEIVLTAAEPVSTRVRIQYADDQNLQQEVWERPAPQIAALKAKILDLLNQEGKALIALNAMQRLNQVQVAITARHLQRLPSPRTAAAFAFIVKSIALAIAYPFWLDAAISGTIDMLLLISWVQNYPLLRSYAWWGAIAANSLLTASLGFETALTQIGWMGVSLTLMLQWLRSEIEFSSGWGKDGAKTLIQQICQQAPERSILKRIIKASDLEQLTGKPN